MNLLTTIISVFFIFLIGLLPFRLLYFFSDFARFFLHRVIGYRKKVITENLERCFPEKSKKEIDALVSKSYKNLTDVMVEGFKAFTMTNKQLIKRHKIINPELLELPQHAAMSAGWFWSTKGLNTMADQGQFEKITRRINGGLNGLDDRQALYDKALKVLA
jgi:hypothetical protein